MHAHGNCYHFAILIIPLGLVPFACCPLGFLKQTDYWLCLRYTLDTTFGN